MPPSAVLDSQALVDFAVPRWQGVAGFEIRDAYKWLYQAALGAEHAVRDPEFARSMLEREWKDLSSAASTEPLWEPLRPDGEIGRLNLRPYRDARGERELLLKAFIFSSSRPSSDAADLRSSWHELGQRLHEGPIANIAIEDWEQLDREIAAANYPAVHHSRGYKAAHALAYRVLYRAEYLELKRLLPS